MPTECFFSLQYCGNIQVNVKSQGILQLINAFRLLAVGFNKVIRFHYFKSENIKPTFYCMVFCGQNRKSIKYLPMNWAGSRRFHSKLHLSCVIKFTQTQEACSWRHKLYGTIWRKLLHKHFASKISHHQPIDNSFVYEPVIQVS